MGLGVIYLWNTLTNIFFNVKKITFKKEIKIKGLINVTHIVAFESENDKEKKNALKYFEIVECIHKFKAIEWVH